MSSNVGRLCKNFPTNVQRKGATNLSASSFENMTAASPLCVVTGRNRIGDAEGWENNCEKDFLAVGVAMNADGK